MPCEAACTRSLLCAATIITEPGSSSPRKWIAARYISASGLHCGLPWDAVLGSDLVRHYKPDAEMYRAAIHFLGDDDPGSVMMVAAHNNDLVQAASHGMKTAFVARPYEHGARQTRDAKAEHDFTYVATSFEDLAAQLGC